MNILINNIFLCVGVVLCLFFQGCSRMENEVIKGSSGYQGDVSNWISFLSCWEKEILDMLNRKEEFYTPEEKLVYERQSARFDPAALGRISELEKRLNITLPKSYKDFLRASNGWIHVNFDASDGVILSVENVGWLIDKESSVVRDWLQNAGGYGYIPDHKYYQYGTLQDPIDMRNEYLKYSLMISDVVDAGVFLLNPKVVTEDGEWEAWFFGWELPGAYRFKSFAHLMRYAYYKATQNPEYDGIYPEVDLAKTCANLLPVVSEKNTAD